MNVDDLLETFKAFAVENPYTGTSQQIVTLSLGIAEASKRLDTSTFFLYKEAANINDKIFSKLKVIGEKILELNDGQRRDVIKVLPSSYSTIHVLCALSAKELVTAAKSKVVTPSLSVRAAKEYVKQVRFPRAATNVGEKGRWGVRQELIFNIYRPEDVPLAGEALEALAKALRTTCADFGVEMRHASNTTIGTLEKQQWGELEVFWRCLLEKQLTEQWWEKKSGLTKKQFELRKLEELFNAPLRSFTGFLIRAEGSRELFWELHGQAYIAKLQMEQARTTDRGNRFNLKRRLEKVMGERKELAIWNNIVLKENGFI